MADDFASLDALLTANLSSEAQAVLTPDMKTVVNKGLQIAGDLTPTYNLIDTLAKGGTPDPQAAIAAMAGLATVANPVAGAVVMAAGELVFAFQQGVESLFRDLGLIDDAPKPVQFVGLVKKGHPRPTGPSDLGVWWPWENFAVVWFTGSATDYTYNRPDSRLTGTEVNVTNTPESQVAWNLLFAAADGDYTIHDRPGHFNITKTGPENGQHYRFIPTNTFEAFFFEVLKRDLEYWANGLPWIDPRILLDAAVKAWNDKHPPAPGAAYVYSPPANESAAHNPILIILSSKGDITGNGQRHTIDVVNGGHLLTSPPPAGPGGSVATVHAPVQSGPQIVYSTLHIVTRPPSAANLTFGAAYQKYLAQGLDDQAAQDAATRDLTGKGVVVPPNAIANAVKSAPTIVAKAHAVKPWTTAQKLLAVGALAAGGMLVLRAKG